MTGDRGNRPTEDAGEANPPDDLPDDSTGEDPAEDSIERRPSDEPTEAELERAARIRRLRLGGATGEIHRRRRQRRAGDEEWAKSGDGWTTGEADARPAEGAGAGSETVEKPSPEDAETGSDRTNDGMVSAMDLAAKMPEDASLLLVPVREDLRREFNRVSEQLHLRYGFQYDAELDHELHIRPLALYLGVEALDDRDVSEVKSLLESADVLDGPE